jgi:hypothetical protein
MHQQSDIHHLSPIPEYSSTGLGLLIPVPDCFRYQHFFSFQYRTDRMPDSLAFQHSKELYDV